MFDEILQGEEGNALNRTPNREGGGHSPPRQTPTGQTTGATGRDEKGKSSKTPFDPSGWVPHFGFGLPSGEPPRPLPGGGDGRRHPTDRVVEEAPQEESEDEDDTETITSSSQPDELPWTGGTGGAGGPPEDPEDPDDGTGSVPRRGPRAIEGRGGEEDPQEGTDHRGPWDPWDPQEFPEGMVISGRQMFLLPQG